MWGQRPRHLNQQVEGWNTPTYVGTTANIEVTVPNGEEHPHVCGDNFCASSVDKLRVGTPPRMWGQLDDAAGV